jgi:hypothetical protein
MKIETSPFLRKSIKEEVQVYEEKGDAIVHATLDAIPALLRKSEMRC